MSTLRWDDVRDLFDADVVGALPDGWVEGGVTVDDWQTVLDLVRTGPWRVDGDAFPTAAGLAARLADPEAESPPPIRVEVAPAAWVHLWFFMPTAIDFDLDARAFRGQEELDGLCDFLRAVGRALGRSVWVGAEGSTDDRMYGYDVTLDGMVRRAEPAPWW
ncbi:hypothetical protein [Cellulomonas sp. SLBN-39]|uniref:hypothetical protein n=1 Tax=Cellulomonas sp. SLBN-39 TaxID=2768446 RepID=UPI00114E1A56|nr:hypothetical protein [Cellulomonas sp. SLBN-39]